MMLITKISRFFYDIFTYLVSPLLIVHLIFRSISDQRYTDRIAERFGFYEKENNHDSIWIHAVSYGEVNAAQSLVRSPPKPQNPLKLKSANSILFVNTILFIYMFINIILNILFYNS